MIASVNLDVSIVNVTNENVVGQRRKSRERKRMRQTQKHKKKMKSYMRKKQNRVRNKKERFIFSYCYSCFPLCYRQINMIECLFNQAASGWQLTYCAYF